MKNVLVWLVQIGMDPADDDDIRLRKSLLVVGALPFALAGALWGLMYFLFDEPLAGIIPLSYAAISLLSVVHFGLTRRYHLFRFSQPILILLLPFFLMVMLGGFINGSAVILWALICPLGALLFDRPARATYELIKEEFICDPHGTVYVKGKGEMEVWYVIQAAQTWDTQRSGSRSDPG